MKPITKDIFEIVTSLILAQLEKGAIPWKQPWRRLGPPRNYVSGRPYRGINLLLLANAGYSSNQYLTFNQVKDLGGKVRKGEKGHPVILWLWVNEDKRKQQVQARPYPLLRYYHVFNVSQCERLPEKPGETPKPVIAPIEICEMIIDGFGTCPNIVHNEDEAYYHVAADYINMPKMETFKSGDAYYTTLFHEIIHSTGHADRLNRKELVAEGKFGSEPYGIEELTAQMGACYLSSYAGIATEEFDNNVAYIQGWLKKLKEDKRFIVYASAAAQKAVDYVLNIKHDENELVELIPGSPGYQPDTRNLKVYYGFNATAKAKIPVIRLGGNYLKEAGFKIGDKLSVTIENNCIEITKEFPSETD